ncbi:hypothetical protein LIER_34707 [Lithospermum erythrorhizon]|uniref:Uncharacterized protein n=1 Tax=Lithospermum erythrorhizon TaxID=34254 RepID=A0AAV3S122_LITER
MAKLLLAIIVCISLANGCLGQIIGEPDCNPGQTCNNNLDCKNNSNSPNNPPICQNGICKCDIEAGPYKCGKDGDSCPRVCKNGKVGTCRGNVCYCR